MIKNKDAFAPFSTGTLRTHDIKKKKKGPNSSLICPIHLGPYGCIAKRMALMDIRQVISRLVWTFEFDFTPGEDGATFEKNGVDAFIMTFGEVNLTFKRRDA